MRVIKAPERVRKLAKETSVFLAGSIEMGKAELWQDKVASLFSDKSNVVLLNPRRDDWDSSWVQEFSNPEFNQQVSWELKNINTADWVIVYFDPATQSPITLLELGTRVWSASRTIVVCPVGYFRKGNVDIFCDSNDINQFDTLEDAVEYIIENLEL